MPKGMVQTAEEAKKIRPLKGRCVICHTLNTVSVDNEAYGSEEPYGMPCKACKKQQPHMKPTATTGELVLTEQMMAEDEARSETERRLADAKAKEAM
jgi:hypothetical protein